MPHKSTWRSSLMTGMGPDNKRILVFELHTLRAGGPGLLKKHRKKERASIEDSLKKNGQAKNIVVKEKKGQR